MSNPANNPHITPASNVETSDEGFDEAPWNSPKGRIGRLKYLGMVLALNLSFAAWFLFYSVFLELAPSEETVDIITGIFVTILFVMLLFGTVFSFIFMIKRLHDLCASSWFSVLSLVFIVNMFMLLFLLLWPGNKGSNKFGPPPRPWNE